MKNKTYITLFFIINSFILFAQERPNIDVYKFIIYDYTFIDLDQNKEGFYPKKELENIINGEIQYFKNSSFDDYYISFSELEKIQTLPKEVNSDRKFNLKEFEEHIFKTLEYFLKSPDGGEWYQTLKTLWAQKIGFDKLYIKINNQYYKVRYSSGVYYY
ncbi:hypothetical protein HX052_17000 [Myroides marinus]|uniref:hypothetical protein n=1 Tax=Myroides marinus TaxID=703342 RepID=UPI002576DB54|nr:hypothetical protein [Myroides marinus]MDM1348824.1 hypothetical protein [Myroides marinus]MDM1370299.1 hypothetical protein [Myroides marinus]MDM1373779.1 hypothetical protein [Myroides marinus]MDM1384626.1 hypothetical protein [Myroides marinus]MDM1391637.1 hypothetical protein [Myroides marinus]